MISLTLNGTRQALDLQFQLANTLDVLTAIRAIGRGLQASRGWY
jgi:hypothetical protein